MEHNLSLIVLFLTAMGMDETYCGLLQWYFPYLLRVMNLMWKMVIKPFYFPWMIILVVEFGLWISPIPFLAFVTYGGSTNSVIIRWYLSSLGHHKRKFVNVIACWYEDFLCIVILFYFCNTFWALNYDHVESKIKLTQSISNSIQSFFRQPTVIFISLRCVSS